MEIDREEGLTARQDYNMYLEDFYPEIFDYEQY